MDHNNNTAFADNNNNFSNNKGTISNCQLNSPSGNITHVIHIQFDNTHFTRDNPNVPSDLEQMPHLLNFIKEHGVLYTNHHTPLISHTATDLLTGITGVYPDRMGVPVSNSFPYFKDDGKTSTASAFTYWTAPLFDRSIPKPSDTKFTMLTADGKNTPAPWVPYTRAGCNFGAVGAANAALQNVPSDINMIFGSSSTEAREAANNADQAYADYIGIAIHCSKDSTMCSQTNNGTSDHLPDEPLNYSGYMALFGHKYVAPLISSSLPMKDLNGTIIHYVGKTGNYTGFPGFDGMSPAVSLAYVAAMQERGIPITYAYISDSHDAHPPGKSSTSYGPGETDYVKALKENDQAFAKFFDRLKNDGITEANTLFIFTADEGDHFVGKPSTPANCDGITIACNYDRSYFGEINVNMPGLLANQTKVTTPFVIHEDDAPTVYLEKNPARNATVTREFERATANLTALNPMTKQTDNITKFLADPVEMKILHMVTNDTSRTPTFTLFADPNYYLRNGMLHCDSSCITQDPKFAWNHGDVQPDITTTWLGMVGPGINNKGIDNATWSDHTDIRPTMMLLLGLKDDYDHDGRALVENMTGSAIPNAIKINESSFLSLAEAYKKINAPLGQLSLDTLKISTQALKSNDTGDSVYNKLENQLINFTDQRDVIKNQMVELLKGAEFEGKAIDPQKVQALITQANTLLDQVSKLADSLDGG